MARCGIGIRRKKRKSLVGTLGCLVQDSEGTEYILSNNHILANFNKAKKKDRIFRKGRRKHIATLTRWKCLSFNGPTNRIDAAIAELTRPGLVNPEIKKIGRVHETMAATIGQRVHKYGHATGHTTGVVQYVGVTPNKKGIPTGDGRTMKFENQIVIKSDSKKPFSKEGDSGSLVIDRATNKVVGLIFANTKKNTYTIANPIDEVLAAFKVTFV